MKLLATTLLPLIALSLQACDRRLPQGSPPPPKQSPPVSPIYPIIKTALSDPESLRNILFSDVVRASSGKEIIPLDPNLPADAELIAALENAINNTLLRFNRPDSPTSTEKRINEVSKHFEAALQLEIDSTDGFVCAPPLTRAGKTQHSGYPDLRIVHQETGRVSYLDPKLVASDSINSSLRSFYFTPKNKTGKIQEDSHHLLLGIEHDGHNGSWKFTGWNLVDLSLLKIRLKPEFQASNRDIYRKELILSKNQTKKVPTD